MAEFSGTTTVSVDPDAAFAWLADIVNLPTYFSRMTSARPGQGEEIHTTASLPDGRSVEGNAWFRTDAGRRHIEWGSEGPNDYHGLLDISVADGGAEVSVVLNTTRVADDDQDVRDGIEETLEAIRSHLG